MKPILYILLPLTVIGALFFIIRMYIEPKFYLEKVDNIKKEGSFKFGNKTHSFSASKTGSASSRNGYVLTYKMKDGKYTFDLYKNGKFIKTLKKIW